MISRDRLGRGTAILALVVFGLAGFMWSWGTWPDTLIDYGSQLYMGWQVSEGAALYRDIEPYKGPLSPYLLAAWFRVFGVSLISSVQLNLVFLVCFVFFLYRIFRMIVDRVTATVAGLFFLAVFAFGQYGLMGSFNFVCPYSMDVVHGIVLSAGAVWCMMRHTHRPSKPLAAVVGFLTGLVMLTDTHIFCSLLVALICWLAVTRPIRGRLSTVVVAACGMIIPVLAGIYLLSQRITPLESWSGFIRPWQWILTGAAMRDPFYQKLIGVSYYSQNLHRMLSVFAVDLLPIGWFIAFAGMLDKQERYYSARLGVIGAAVLLALGLNMQRIPYFDCWRPLPLFMLIVSWVAWRLYQFDINKAEARATFSGRIILVVWALALLGKIVLRCRVQDYGFALAVPAVLFVVVGILDWVPQLMDRYRWNGQVFRLCGAILFCVLAFGYFQISSYFFAARRVVVGQGRDQFMADERGVLLRELLREIEQRVGKQETLAVWPNAPMVNYLSRRKSVRYLGLTSLALYVFGERSIVESLRRQPPDFILLNYDLALSDPGFRFFGRDYAQSIGAWIDQDYVEVLALGDPSLQHRRFGMRFLQRRSGNSANVMTQ